MANIIPLETLESLEILDEVAQKGANATREDWEEVSRRAKDIADSLRTEILRTELGKSGLVGSCAALLPLSLAPNASATPRATTELLRVLGNLCFDHDVNRQLSFDAQAPAAILDVLATSLSPASTSSTSSPTSTFSLDDLKLIRATVGALLNMSLKFNPIREQLQNPAALSLLLALVDARSPTARGAPPVYVVNSWASHPSGDVGEWKAKIQAGSMTAGWAMNMLEDLLSGDKDAFPPSGIVSLSSIIVASQSPPSPTSSSPWTPSEASDHVESDLELLTCSASLLEALSIDLELAKQEIAFASFSSSSPPSSPSPSSTLLSHLLTFIDTASPPPHWPEDAASAKAFGTVKSGVVRAVVESPNSDVVRDKLFMAGQGTKNWVLEKLVEWVGETKEGREDLLICAAHMLAALGRKDEYCVILVQEYGLAAPLSALVVEKVQQQLSKASVRPGEVTQILFGVVSLLRHLSIPVPNKAVLGETGVIETVALLLRPELDMVTPLQNAVVGLLKHLTASNLANSLHFIGVAPTPPNITTLVASSLTSSPSSPATPLDALVALIPRTDDVRLRSEASRTLVNVVRSFFSSKPYIGGDTAHSSPISPSSATMSPSLSQGGGAMLDEDEIAKRKGRPKIVRVEVVTALSEMVRLSEKYPMLINEGVVGLTLLAGSGAVGALLVLEALLLRHEPAPAEAASESSMSSTSTPARTTSLALTSAGDPPTALGMLVTWLSLAASGALSSAAPSPTNAGVRPEMVTNACALLITVMRGAEVAKADKSRIDMLRVQILGPLHGASETSPEGPLKKIAARALEVVEGK
ncbi:hypothetical protein RQP46_011352 [Phenoliferia psychrophenolica]